MGCLIATSEDDDDDDGSGATGDEVDDDGDDGDGTERRNNQIEVTAAAGGNWLEGRASCVARMPGEDNNLIIFKQT
jgi:hypothetical protein